ncbi:MAG: hypothetical protein JOZ42_17025 [Acetobacteraceae bacterium]|nr:hypothetical protein [Acetobacteraceae bacterium]
MSLLALLATLGLVLFTTLSTPLKDDVAWLLYMAGRWLDGQRLYVDLIEVNPPLIIWISAVPEWLTEWSGLSGKQVALPFFAALVLASAWGAANLLRPVAKLFENRLAVFSLAGTVLIGLAGPELGQREHLLMAAMLPYLCIFARSLDRVPTRAWASIAAGVLAGLGCALKPRYGLVLGLLECVALASGLRPWRTMTISAGATVAAYVAAVLAIYPAYLERAVPLGIALYGATDAPFSWMLWDNVPVMLGEAAVLLLYWLTRRQARESSLVLTLGVFAIGSTLVCFLDGKNWFYHRLPATVAIVLALLVWAGSVLTRPAAEWRRLAVPLLLVASACTVFGVAAAQRLKPQVELACAPGLSTEARVERLIRREGAKTYVAFSEWIALGFPVVNNTGVVWASRFDSMWALKGELWRTRFDPATSKEWPVRRWVARDFVAGCPDLVVVDTREGLNYIAILRGSDPAFANAWSQYKQIAAFDGLRVFKHGGERHCTGRPKLLQAQIDTRPTASGEP